MYIVSVKDDFRTCEKEYKSNAWAIKEAKRVRSVGYIYFDNPLLFKEQRKVIAKEIKVYNEDTPDEIIPF